MKYKFPGIDKQLAQKMIQKILFLYFLRQVYGFLQVIFIYLVNSFIYLIYLLSELNRAYDILPRIFTISKDVNRCKSLKEVLELAITIYIRYVIPLFKISKIYRFY